jgi:hypothetical protein
MEMIHHAACNGSEETKEHHPIKMQAPDTATLRRASSPRSRITGCADRKLASLCGINEAITYTDTIILNTYFFYSLSFKNVYNNFPLAPNNVRENRIFKAIEKYFFWYQCFAHSMQYFSAKYPPFCNVSNIDMISNYDYITELVYLRFVNIIV